MTEAFIVDAVRTPVGRRNGALSRVQVPGTTIDRQCGSSQQAVHFAAQAVMSGTADLVVAGGVEVMSLVPIASPAIVGVREGMGSPYDGVGWRTNFGEQEVSQFRGAEMIAEKWDVSREDMERFALQVTSGQPMHGPPESSPTRWCPRSGWGSTRGRGPKRTNPCGGAIALGHPLGATGARLMTTLVHQLRRTGGRFGLQTMCEGGGMANATIIERL